MHNNIVFVTYVSAIKYDDKGRRIEITSIHKKALRTESQHKPNYKYTPDRIGKYKLM